MSIDKLSYENLPTSNESRGLKFVLETAFPLRLSDDIIHYPELSLRWVQQTWSEFIHNIFSPYYFIHFRDVYKLDGEKVIMAITREELSIAWIDSLNGVRYHQGLLNHIRMKQKYFDLDLSERELSVVIYQLEQTCRDWSNCYRELDLALGLLREYEQARIVPKK
ncbi:uncharacterized protein I206_103685 [Kwoniella pini CBS 10737]|uniref:Uncharacterized protein n=1 Tax=Kwoniella pini CBS 10737 TaxID=1296096 RepID=A0A1B9I9H1_9TREE|nr:uncharacterized protein I206_01315 [Kwoniella pini CBS 10737]OCF52031.1 hypothetical protein I206_01315 [Kwoniella pini CBS 10737]